MKNSAEQDQLASDLDLHYLQWQDISGFSRTRVKRNEFAPPESKRFLFMVDTVSEGSPNNFDRVVVLKVQAALFIPILDTTTNFDIMTI